MRYALIFLFLLFSGCTHHYYVPKKIEKDVNLYESLGSLIKEGTPQVITLRDGSVIDEKGKVIKHLTKGVTAIDATLSKRGSTLFVGEREIEFDKLIVSATKREDLVAVILADGMFVLYDLKSDTRKITYTFDSPIAFTKEAPRVLFYKNMIMIPTLTGQISLFDATTFKKIKTFQISKKELFNNIIFMKVVDDRLIIASRDNIIVIAENFLEYQFGTYRNILADDKNIYIFTIDGKIEKYDMTLKKIKETKFSYANFVSPTFYKNRIVFGENSLFAHLISIDKDFNETKVYNLNVSLASDAFFLGDRLYFYDRSVPLSEIDE